VALWPVTTTGSPCCGNPDLHSIHLRSRIGYNYPDNTIFFVEQDDHEFQYDDFASIFGIVNVFKPNLNFDLKLVQALFYNL
jgi:hypothetical protein